MDPAADHSADAQHPKPRGNAGVPFGIPPAGSEPTDRPPSPLDFGESKVPRRAEPGKDAASPHGDGDHR